MGELAQDLLGEVEGVVLSLLEAEARIWLKVLKGNLLPPGKGVIAAHEDVRSSAEERGEREVVLLKELPYDLPVEAVLVEKAYFAPHLRDVADDLVGPGLAEGELVLIEAEPLHQVGEGLDGEDVMLGGDRAELADGIPAAEAVLVEGHLIHDLPRVDQELLSLPCNGELAAAVEDPDAELVLDLLKGRREAGL